MKKVLTGLVITLALIAFTANAAWLPLYDYRIELTVDNGDVDGDLTNFPVLVALNSGNFDFTKAEANGFDIRFTSSDGETLLKYERERHDNGNELAEYWVKLPLVASASDTVFYLYSGKAGDSDGADPENVWESEYLLVLHMNDNSATNILDSTSYNNNGAKFHWPSWTVVSNSPVEIDGKIGKCQSNPNLGDGNSILIDYFDKRDTGQTISLWYYMIPDPGMATWQGIFIKRHSMLLGFNTGSSPMSLWYRPNWESPDIIAQHASVATGTWVYVSTRYDDVSSNAWVYVNGALIGGPTLTAQDKHAAQWWQLFKTEDKDDFLGHIDEVRYTADNRSPAWMRAQYETQRNDFLTFSAQATEPTTGTVVTIK